MMSRNRGIYPFTAKNQCAKFFFIIFQLWSKSTSSLRRDFHSTPDLAAEHTTHPPRTRSSEDVHGTHILSPRTN